VAPAVLVKVAPTSAHWAPLLVLSITEMSAALLPDTTILALARMNTLRPEGSDSV